ncbi:hypothetical protein [Planctomonas deserti]|uniref:hypothetical protein n=1 Tax=Planctomonas deserti TaxID=2144185 RepID=UPI000D3A6E36|nr:hypothetical protein [Planctomonas deserti]
MLTMEPEHRQVLTAALLRVLKAADTLTRDCVHGPLTAWSWSAEIAASNLNLAPAWDGNVLHTRLRADTARGAEAAREHGLALFELARSRRELAVPLATVTRAAIEAYGRVYWLLSAETAEECVSRLASLEYLALSYPERVGALLRRLPFEVEATKPVDAHRQNLAAWAKARGVTLGGGAPGVLAIALLEVLYPEHGAYTYAGLSGAAHANEWATANFFDFQSGRIRRDDKMLMEYCMYVIEATKTICDLLVQRFEPDVAVTQRWSQAYEGAQRSIAGFINRTPDA